MTISFLVGCVTLLIGILNLIALYYGIFKVVNRNEREWLMREDRLVDAEKAIVQMQGDLRVVTAISVQIGDMKNEIERMRTRLDRFLDSQNAMRS